MSVQIKNATVTVYPVSKAVNADGVNGNPEKGTGTVVACYFEESTPGEMYQAVGVELSGPAFLQCEIADAVHFSPNAVVEVSILVNGSPVSRGTYFQHGIAEIHQVGNEADHADVYLSRTQYPGAN